jgi:hypothetical protein
VFSFTESPQVHGIGDDLDAFRVVKIRGITIISEFLKRSLILALPDIFRDPRLLRLADIVVHALNIREVTQRQ